MNRYFSKRLIKAMLLCFLATMYASAQAGIEDEVFYFVIPDRFANGDPSNDTGGLEGDRTQHGYDPTDGRYFHGGDLKGLTSKLRYLKTLGVTAIWISPPFKNKPVEGETAGYHGYWAQDYTQVDPHWGTNDELSEFIDAAHRYRIKVFFDVVLNHTADIIKYQECHNSDGSLISGSCDYRSKAEQKYTPFLPAGQENTKQPQWLNDPQYYNNQGDSSFSGESTVYGDFFGLDDLDTQNQTVIDGMVDIFSGWISDFKIDGFRVDTIKHVDIGLWQQWIPAIQAHAQSEGIDDFFIFGEMFDGNPGNLSKFTRDAEFPSVLDFGLYYAIKDTVTGNQGTHRLADIFAQDDLYTGDGSHANQLMNFVSNHDVGRIGHFIQNMPGISDSDKLARAKLAQDMMFFSRGIPVIYYGDEQGFTGDGGDSDAREDMMASNVINFNDNDLIGTDSTTADDNFDVRHPLFTHIRTLTRTYKMFPELRSGVQYVRYSQGTPGVFALSRFSADKKRESLVLFNTSTTEQSVTLAPMADKYSQVFPRISSRGPAFANGMLDITVPPLSSVVYISTGKLALPSVLPDIELASLTEGQIVSGVVDVTAQLTDADDRGIAMHRVHFSVSVDGGEFEPLGTDSNPDYRVFFNTDNYADGTQFTFKATVDNYGAASQSTIVTVEKGIIQGMRVIFKKPQDWGEPSIYWWNADPQSSPDWPGIEMTPLIDDWYVFQFDEGVSKANIIFNAQGTQTGDLFREGDGCYVDQQWSDTCDVPEPGMTVYFEKPAGWGDNINLYWFNAAPQGDASWPGEPMELIGEGWYKFQFDNNVASASLIFNDGTNQTADLSRQSDGCYSSGNWLENCVPPTKGLKLYFKKPNGWGTTANIYFWDAAPANSPDWPGIAMQEEGNDWFSYQFPLNVSQANIIFNDGEGQQTSDLFRDTDGCYIDANWQDSCELDAIPPGMTVYFRRPLDWGIPNVHYWNDGGATDWPGVEMDALGNDWFALQLPDGVTATNLIFNDKTGGDGNQTGDLYREGDGCYDLATEAWSDSCATPGYKVFFQKPAEWSTANAYFWAGYPIDAANVNWPGEAMTLLGDDWYQYQLPNGVQGSNIIFNNAGSPQTADLSREGNGCYTLDEGWSDSCDVPTPGMTVYFYKPGNWADATNIYYWGADGAPGWPGVPMVSLGEGWFSYTFPQGVEEANIIFNDGGSNQTGDLSTANGGCYGQYGDLWRKSCVLPATVEVEIVNRAAHWLSEDTIAWQNTDSRGTDFRLYYSSNSSIATDSGNIIGEDSYISLDVAGNLAQSLQDARPHLASLPALQLTDTASVELILKGQLVVAAFDSGGNLLEATGVQIPGVLDDIYPYQGDLGVTYSAGEPSVALWAPTAQQVELVIFDDTGAEVSRHQADSVVQGTYIFNGNVNWDKQYYLFDMMVYHPLSDAIEQYMVTDPYALSLSQNSQKAQFLDLKNDPTLKPTDWDAMQKVLPEFQDITLYEGHIRDFSQQDASVAAADRGKYLAFTYNGIDGAELSNGMAHLKGLQQAGLSHFHLLPVFDISSIDEDSANRVDLDDTFSRLCSVSSAEAVQSRCDSAGDTTVREVLGDLKINDPSNADIQAIVAEMVNLDSFNWGYDPFHFNAPEGSYASDQQGETRVLEFREMVKGLQEIGLNVVMDVVYNHTSASGLYNNSVLDRTVPGYYHRLNPVTGAVENSTCCDNTATEHKMMERLMVDTLVNWAEMFKVDSFRFDLMGHIPKSAMQAAQQRLSQLTLAANGVDGSKIYLYGEGWDFGEVAGNQRFEQATQFNMAGTGIGTFNDRIRAAVRGGNFTDSGRSQGWTSGNELFPNGYAVGGGVNDQADRIRIGLTGNLQQYPFIDNGGSAKTGVNYAGVGYALDPQESVNYVDKHDNESLWDNTQAKLPDSMGIDDRVRVHMISNALINYGQGIPFYQMGTDLLRSKSLDRNSYNSGDWFNAVDFTAQDNNWAAGLPLAQDNESRWTTMADIINNGNIVVQPNHISKANAIFRDQLAVRYSSPLFRLADAESVIDRVAFHNTGASQQSGLIAMSVSDGLCSGEDLDPNYDGVLVLFNADDAAMTIEIPSLHGLVLHPILASGSDDVVKTTNIDSSSFTVPAHTAAVLVKEQQGGQGEFACNPQAATENQPGFITYFKKPDSWSQVRIYFWETSPVSASTGWPGEVMQSLGDGWYSYQMPNGVEASNIIFNNNAGEQTENLYREGDGCYDFGLGAWSDTCTLPGLTFYFKKPAEWSDNVHIHYWNADGVSATDWPGQAMNSLGNDWYSFMMPEGVRSTSLLFNDAASGGTGLQTQDFSRTHNGCYQTDAGWVDSCEELLP